MGLLGAVAGVVHHPMRTFIEAEDGARCLRILLLGESIRRKLQPNVVSLRSAAAFAAGVGRGMLGLVLKPVGGFLELVERTGGWRARGMEGWQ